ncbi:hypothetical protein HMPREF1870_00792 [Bacteroidales bacterium KA00344]|nr:hypothetical protein HMPREF1870_00792 [Bacteroidales bacterium KA00344]
MTRVFFFAIVLYFYIFILSNVYIFIYSTRNIIVASTIFYTYHYILYLYE